MLLLEKIVIEERLRIERMIRSYEHELSILPKGSLVRKRIQNRDYAYLQYRDGKRMVSKYIGKDTAQIAVIEQQIVRKRQIEALLKGLKQEYALACKIVEG